MRGISSGPSGCHPGNSGWLHGPCSTGGAMAEPEGKGGCKAVTQKPFLPVNTKKYKLLAEPGLVFSTAWQAIHAVTAVTAVPSGTAPGLVQNSVLMFNSPVVRYGQMHHPSHSIQGKVFKFHTLAGMRIPQNSAQLNERRDLACVPFLLIE